MVTIYTLSHPPLCRVNPSVSYANSKYLPLDSARARAGESMAECTPSQAEVPFKAILKKAEISSYQIRCPELILGAVFGAPAGPHD